MQNQLMNLQIHGGARSRQWHTIRISAEQKVLVARTSRGQLGGYSVAQLFRGFGSYFLIEPGHEPASHAPSRPEVPVCGTLWV